MLPRHQCPWIAVAILGLLTLTISTPTILADWPQWLGPQRDGVWKADNILDKFPDGGLKPLWKQPINGGYTGPAIVGEFVYVMDRQSKEPDQNTPKGDLPGNERVLCLNFKTGETVWTHEYDCTYRKISRVMGPRTTPVVDNGKVYSLGTMGDLCCLDAKTGKPLWQKSYINDYKATPPVWGYSSHLLVHGDLLISLVGGDQHAVVAFDKNSGVEKWSALSTKDIAYSPPIIVKAGGCEQLIIWLSDKLCSLNPKTGEVYWQHKQPISGGQPGQPSTSISTPKLVGDILLVSSATDGMFAVKMATDQPKSEVLYRSENEKQPDKFPILMTTIISKGEHIYSIDANTGNLLCVEPKSCKEVWRSVELFGKEATFGTAFWVEQGDRVLTFTDAGDLVILKLNPTQYEEISRTHLIDPIGADRGRKVVWSHPAFSDGKIVVRNEKEIICYSLTK